MITLIDPQILQFIPDPGTVRRRLAVVLTEACLLRRQMRISERLEKERARLMALAREMIISNYYNRLPIPWTNFQPSTNTQLST